jgi:hypothetical protein
VSDRRPFLEIPLPSTEDYILLEEWAKKKKEQEEKEQKDRGHVIVIDI